LRRGISFLAFPALPALLVIKLEHHLSVLARVFPLGFTQHSPTPDLYLGPLHLGPLQIAVQDQKVPLPFLSLHHLLQPSTSPGGGLRQHHVNGDLYAKGHHECRPLGAAQLPLPATPSVQPGPEALRPCTGQAIQVIIEAYIGDGPATSTTTATAATASLGNDGRRGFRLLPEGLSGSHETAEGTGQPYREGSLHQLALGVSCTAHAACSGHVLLRISERPRWAPQRRGAAGDLQHETGRRRDRRKCIRHREPLRAGRAGIGAMGRLGRPVGVLLSRYDDGGVYGHGAHGDSRLHPRHMGAHRRRGSRGQGAAASGRSLADALRKWGLVCFRTRP
ncbi:hypothetical protein CI238_11831, partial [Colletotrichum incanum]